MASYVDSTLQLVVELSVRDLERSLSFYERIGFRCSAGSGRSPSWLGKIISSSCLKMAF
jgi:hypothetical protein